jgi:hypothetical protein
VNWTIKEGDCLEVLRTMEMNSVDALVTDPPAGIGFMGKGWDSDKGGRDEWVKWLASVMRECHRVMKPGAHGLVWALPRTSHWTAMALEDAGFEIRDRIQHIFGSGFPKSLDISKAIDKAAGAKREVVGLAINSYPDSGRKDMHRVGGGKVFDQGDGLNQNIITAPATDAAKEWSGWGTALKPASEDWWLIRKPLSEKNVAANVLKWGVGGLNIDGGRIGVSDNDPNHRKPSTKFGTANNPATTNFGSGGRPTPNLSSQGRFPSNLVFSHTEHCTDDQCDIECAIAMLDEQSGPTGGAPGVRRNNAKAKSVAKGAEQANETMGYSDSGGASRFFYCAKISPSERNAGLEEKTNAHPTVKAQKLMRYLVKLITPPGGLVLDPFAGSGSTGVAALTEGFRFIGIEMEQEYFSIAKMRCLNAVEAD